jgi:hypothetical protein
MPTYKDLPDFDEAHTKGVESTLWGPRGSEAEGRAMLNLLTPEVVLEAKKEIQDGVSVGLKCAINRRSRNKLICHSWNLRMLDHPSFGRLPYSHKIVPVGDYET